MGGMTRLAPRRPASAIALAIGAAMLLAGPSAALAAPAAFAPWIDGTAASEPEMQVQAIDADTFGNR